MGINVAAEHVWTEASGAKALWPRNLRLSKASLDAGGFERLPEWEESLARLLYKQNSAGACL